MLKFMTFYTGKVTQLSQETSTSGRNNIKITELIDLVDLKTETADRKHQIFSIPDMIQLTHFKRWILTLYLSYYTNAPHRIGINLH